MFITSTELSGPSARLPTSPTDVLERCHVHHVKESRVDRASIGCDGLSRGTPASVGLLARIVLPLAPARQNGPWRRGRSPRAGCRRWRIADHLRPSTWPLREVHGRSVEPYRRLPLPVKGIQDVGPVPPLTSEWRQRSWTRGTQWGPRPFLRCQDEILFTMRIRRASSDPLCHRPPDAAAR